MTYITKKCPKCKFVHRASVYGFVQNPIGTPFSRCPACGNVVREREIKEWAQMSPLKKYFSINRRGNSTFFFLGLLLMIPITIPVIMLVEAANSSNSFLAPLAGLLVFPAIVLPFLLAHYILVCSRANKEKFIDSYCDSVLRTRVPMYVDFLNQQGITLRDESIPKIVRLSKKTQEEIARRLDASNTPATIQIPTFIESIQNV